MKNDRLQNGSRLAALEYRLASVERANLRLRTSVAVTLLVMAGLLVAGAGPSARVADVISAGAFDLVDEKGVVRGSLSARGDSGVALTVFGDDGAKATALHVMASDPYLALVDGSGKDLDEQGQRHRRLFSWGAPSERPSEAGEGSKDWPGWAGERPPADQDEEADFDWDNN
jgi:hypothetical protein